MATVERFVIENLFKIADKSGRDVDFILNSAQAELDSALTGRDLIPKARQRGVSAYFLARNLAKCLAKRNTRAVVISHEREATQRMLDRVHYMVDNVRGPRPKIETSSRNEISFPKMNSVFFIGTAGAKKFGRGDTITDLHCSEVAFWEDPKSILAGLFQAVPKDGEISIESTGNGMGNWYHRTCKRAAAGLGSFRLHFIPWHTDEEYQIKLTPAEQIAIMGNLNEEWEELELVKSFNLTAEQLAWRRMKIDELDYDLALFKQEYPMTLDECFKASGRSIFNKVIFLPTKQWELIEPGFHVLQGHPRSGEAYAIGADVSGGVGADASVVEIAHLPSLEQVGEYVNNKISPDTFGNKIRDIGVMFNGAYVNVENNNHGLVTLKELSLIYPNYLLHRRPNPVGNIDEPNKLAALGVRTTALSKPFMVGKLRKLLKDDIVIHSEYLRDELSSFVENATGQLEAEAGCNDDAVMAFAVLVYAVEKAILLLADAPVVVLSNEERLMRDPFSLDYILNEIEKRRNTFPIGPHHASFSVN